MSSWLLCGLLLLAATDITKKNELGPVSVTTTLAPAEPTIGDEITLDIRVEAQADVEVLMPEFGEALSRYSIVNFVPQQRIDAQGRTVLAQRYTLQPYLSGPQFIPPILIEFIDHRPGQQPAPDDFDAYEILTDRIDFVVKSVLPDSATRELQPPLGELELVAERSGWFAAWAVGGCTAVLVAAAAAWLWWRGRRRHVRRRNAYEIARARLDQLLARPWPRNATDIEAFFVTISAIVRRYLEDRFDLRAPELTTEEFLTLAGSAEVLSREHQFMLRDFLRQADLVKFAGLQASEEDVRRSSDLAARFLDETRENAPLIDDPDAAVASPDDSRRSGADLPARSDSRETTHV